jgi:hypothetical protein
LPAEQVNRQVLYVGDEAFDLVDWVNAASSRLTGRKAKTAPRSLLYLLALAGEAAQRCGVKAPLSLLRYRAMTEDYLTPIQRTIDLTGPAPYSMEQAIDETLQWLANREKASDSPTGALVPSRHASPKLTGQSRNEEPNTTVEGLEASRVRKPIAILSE